jgi:hypothetical protein
VELNAVIEDLVRFRIQIRRYALGMDEQLTKEEKRQLVKQRRILFEACDSLRDQLKIKGIHLKVQRTLKKTKIVSFPTKSISNSTGSTDRDYVDSFVLKSSRFRSTTHGLTKSPIPGTSSSRWDR